MTLLTSTTRHWAVNCRRAAARPNVPATRALLYTDQALYYPELSFTYSGSSSRVGTVKSFTILTRYAVDFSSAAVVTAR